MGFSLGGFAAAAGFDLVATRWVPLYEGPYRVARLILAKLDEAKIPNEMRVTYDGARVLVMKTFLDRAREEALAPAVSAEPES